MTEQSGGILSMLGGGGMGGAGMGGLAAANPYAAAGMAAASAIGEVAKAPPAGPAISGAEASYSDRNYINIAPVGVNLGEVLNQLAYPAENGGASFVPDTFGYVSPNNSGTAGILASNKTYSPAASGGSRAQIVGMPIKTVLIIGGLGVALFIILKARKK